MTGEAAHIARRGWPGCRPARGRCMEPVGRWDHRPIGGGGHRSGERRRRVGHPLARPGARRSVSATSLKRRYPSAAGPPPLRCPDSAGSPGSALHPPPRIRARRGPRGPPARSLARSPLVPWLSDQPVGGARSPPVADLGSVALAVVSRPLSGLALCPRLLVYGYMVDLDGPGERTSRRQVRVQALGKTLATGCSSVLSEHHFSDDAHHVPAFDPA